MTDHIKMPAVEPLVRYVANGIETNFAYPFPIFASEDLKVYFDGVQRFHGFDIFDAGETAGGMVVFDEAPEQNVVLTFERRLPLERVTDFLEGGDFSAQAINNELDYLTASIQQINRDIAPILRFSDHEAGGRSELPTRQSRANKVLGFDGNGDPISYPLNSGAPDFNFTAQGQNSQTRIVSDLSLIHI